MIVSHLHLQTIMFFDSVSNYPHSKCHFISRFFCYSATICYNGSHGIPFHCFHRNSYSLDSQSGHVYSGCATGQLSADLTGKHSSTLPPGDAHILKARMKAPKLRCFRVIPADLCKRRLWEMFGCIARSVSSTDDVQLANGQEYYRYIYVWCYDFISYTVICHRINDIRSRDSIEPPQSFNVPINPAIGQARPNILLTWRHRPGDYLQLLYQSRSICIFTITFCSAEGSLAYFWYSSGFYIKDGLPDPCNDHGGFRLLNDQETTGYVASYHSQREVRYQILSNFQIPGLSYRWLPFFLYLLDRLATSWVEGDYYFLGIKRISFSTNSTEDEVILDLGQNTVSFLLLKVTPSSNSHQVQEFSLMTILCSCHRHSVCTPTAERVPSTGSYR